MSNLQRQDRQESIILQDDAGHLYQVFKADSLAQQHPQHISPYAYPHLTERQLRDIEIGRRSQSAKQISYAIFGAGALFAGAIVLLGFMNFTKPIPAPLAPPPPPPPPSPTIKIVCPIVGICNP